jgi:hypothetical protein
MDTAVPPLGSLAVLTTLNAQRCVVYVQPSTYTRKAGTTAVYQHYYPYATVYASVLLLQSPALLSTLLTQLLALHLCHAT